MLELQPDDVVSATLWELEEAVSAVLPSCALVQASPSACGGYNILAQWSSAGMHGNPTRCTLTLHVTVTAVRTYCRWNHPKREAACRQLSDWLGEQVARQAADVPADTGFDLHGVAPEPFFEDDATPVRVTARDRAHDFALYRGAPPPPLT